MHEELIQAINLALADEWDKAHKIVQEIEDPQAYWIHAVLHKIEGDKDNSRYWYSRAQKMEHFGADSTAELQLIRQQIAKEKK